MDDARPEFQYCDVSEEIEGEGNIRAEPNFRDPKNGDYRLMSVSCGDPFDSPCIDAGDPEIDDNTLNCFGGLGKMRSDMGAFGGAYVEFSHSGGRLPGMPFGADFKESFSNSRR